MMAGAVTRKVVREIMSEIRRSVNEQQKTNPQEATISWKLVRNPNKAHSWEYQVVTRGWRIGQREKKKRRILGRMGCYERILTRTFTNNEDALKVRKGPRWSTEIEAAIRGLVELQEFGRIAEKRKETITANEENRQQKGNDAADQGKKRQRLYRLWKEFVMSSRIKKGWYEQLTSLGEGKCRCGRSRISYPHWPPTSIEEADAQFEYSLDENNEHRRTIVIEWWRHFNELANMEEWSASESQQRYKDAEETIREASPIVQRELERTTKVQKRPKGWTCREYCEKVLTENRCECLCFCAEHRDECPTHGRQ
jgi:hypothetical protein